MPTRLLPSSSAPPWRDRLRMALGAGLAVAAAAGLAYAWAGGAGLWLVAPLGASAVLVFAAPSSPFAQPWAVWVGNVLSALWGVACVHAVPGVAWSSGVAVGGAMVLMAATRSMHPAGGATALLMVWLQVRDPWIALFPVGANMAVLVAMAMLLHRMWGMGYPHREAPRPTEETHDEGRFTEADLRAALAEHKAYLDLAPDELARVLHSAQAAAYMRLWGSIRCDQIMSRDPVTADIHTPVREARERMKSLKVRVLPVVDRQGEVVGIVTQTDLIHHPVWREADADEHMPLSRIMTRKVLVARASSHAAEILPLFATGGHHHLPVIDDSARVVGVLTQTDLLRALSHAVRPPPGLNQAPANGRT